MIDQAIAASFDPVSGAFAGQPVVKRFLGDLRGSFADARACAEALAQGNPLLYTVSTIEPALGEGALHCGLGMLMPGRVGAEYYLTRGHCHAQPGAAEVYVGLRGEGFLLLEDASGGESRLLDLRPHGTVYVPGHTAHRTINTGAEPLIYLGIYPAGAGHDYGAMAGRNFRKVLVAEGGQPVLRDRAEFMRHLGQTAPQQ